MRETNAIGVPAAFAACCALKADGLLERTGLLDSLETVLLVSSEWHMARVLWTVKKFFPSTIHFLCCPTLEGCSRSNLIESAECRQLVIDEAVLYTTFKSAGAI